MSKSHISDGEQAASQKDLPFRLTGSQAKTAFALRHNAEEMIRECGIDSVVFLTLTVGELVNGRFVKQPGAAEANRRINNASRRLLPELFEKWIIVTERHKDGAIHFHLLAVVAGRPDVRTGFRHDAVKMRSFTNASAPLRHVWKVLGDRLPDLGFGRAEATPVRKTGEAVASYVSKYVEKNLFNRLDEDRGKKLVRYGGWNRHLRPNDFGWATAGATRWRLKARCAAYLAAGHSEPEEVRAALGPRWALRVTEMFPAVTVETFKFIDSEWLRDLWRRAEHLHGAKMARQAEHYFDGLEAWRELDEEEALYRRSMLPVVTQEEQLCLTL